jgi:hypothetical protein
VTTRQDLLIRQGETFAHVHNAGIDLTGYSARMAVKAGFEGSHEAYLSTGPDADGGTITLGGEAGTVTVAMTAAQASRLAGDLTYFLFVAPQQRAERFITYIYDLKLVSPGGDVHRELQGRVIVEREVTGA